MSVAIATTRAPDGIDAAREGCSLVLVLVGDDHSCACGCEYRCNIRARARAAVADDGNFAVDAEQIVERGRQVGHVSTSLSTQLTWPAP